MFWWPGHLLRDTKSHITECHQLLGKQPSDWGSSSVGAYLPGMCETLGSVPRAMKAKPKGITCVCQTFHRHEEISANLVSGISEHCGWEGAVEPGSSHQAARKQRENDCGLGFLLFHHVALAGPQLTMETRMPSNSQSSPETNETLWGFLRSESWL